MCAIWGESMRENRADWSRTTASSTYPRLVFVAMNTELIGRRLLTRDPILADSSLSIVCRNWRTPKR